MREGRPNSICSGGRALSARQDVPCLINMLKGIPRSLLEGGGQTPLFSACPLPPASSQKCRKAAPLHNVWKKMEKAAL